MEKYLRLLLLPFVFTATVFAADTRAIAPVEVLNNEAIPIRVTASTPDLQALARKAFGMHGAYTVVESPGKFDIAFTATGPGRVRVDVKRTAGGVSVASQELAGRAFPGSIGDANALMRNALLRAADVAVEATNGKGLKGFFASELAFIGERSGKSEVYTSDLFFGNALQITHHNAFAMFPRWSPDGTRLVYTSFFKSGAPDIYMINLSGMKEDTLASFEGTNSGGKFNPNGQQVAMILSGEGTPEVYVRNVDGGVPIRMTVSRDGKSSPGFSPNGDRILFSMGDGAPRLYMMANRKNAPFEQVSPSGWGYCTEPDWSRTNPNLVIFTTRDASKHFQIAVLDMATRGARQVAAKGVNFDGLEPIWLADGRHAVITAQDARTSSLGILDTETGKFTPIGLSFGKTSQASVWMP